MRTVILVLLVGMLIAGCPSPRAKIVVRKVLNDPECSQLERNLPMPVQTPHALYLEPRGSAPGRDQERVCVDRETFDRHGIGSEYRP